MPSGVLVNDGVGGAGGASTAATGDATGARTARSANDVIGVLQTSSRITSNANVLQQSWGHRRFVSAPLAAQTVSFVSATWTFSFARAESNLNHHEHVGVCVYAWRPTTGARVGSAFAFRDDSGTETTVAGAEQANSGTAGGFISDQAILDGDILVFDVTTTFTQAMSTAYTEDFFYDGTTEASTTTCASFASTSIPLTLFTARPPVRTPVTGQAISRAATWMKRHSGIVVPRLWTPADPVAV